jgi:hypothetical protein
MKENSSLSNPCENAAVRVQCWFGKDKENRFQTTLTHDASKMHKYDTVRPLRIVSQVEHLPLQGYALARKKKGINHQVTKENLSKPLRFTVDSSHCCANQKDLSQIHRKNPLSDRVAQCRLKEYLLVSKRLKTFSKQKPTGPKRHEVISIKSTAPQESQNPYFQEWEKGKEERHFQIGRVIKYLTE